MDIVFIRQLQIETVIGIYDWEQTIHQRIVIDLEMATDIRRAAASEDITDALNYHAIAVRLTEFVSGQKFLLIETIAEQCAELVMREFAVPWLRMTVIKPTAVSSASAVGVVIERGAKS
ncbi:MAG: dihydroneopterin aldolase [Spongiibacteraceae bacterium]